MTIPIKGGARVPGPTGTSPEGIGAWSARPQSISFGDVVSFFSGPIVVLQRNYGGKSSSFFSGLPSRPLAILFPPYLIKQLNGMDEQGEQILATYLYGGGDDHDIDDPKWTEYITAHKNLRETLILHLKDIVNTFVAKGPGNYRISDRFHYAFPENHDFSGYALLHGSNDTVGDFLLSGAAEVRYADNQAAGAFDIEMGLLFRFNDIVDPNSKYISDTLRHFAAVLVTMGIANSYRLSINWDSKCTAKVRPGQPIIFSGYPSASE